MVSDTLGKEVFYQVPEKIGSDTLVLDGDEFRHAAKAARMKNGDHIRIVDGKGGEYTGIITQISKSCLTCKIESHTVKPVEPCFDVTLFQALIKGKKFDLVVEKSTELGVNAIVPVRSDRTIPADNPARTGRWEKIALSAMKQSGRSVLPIIGECTRLQEIIAMRNAFDCMIMSVIRGGDPVERIVRHNNAEKPLKIAVLIGPEGGFSPAEIALAENTPGVSFVSLGKRRLRSETAPLVLLSRLFAIDDLCPGLKAARAVPTR